uniref:AAA+ ATPase domain-containing protein n=1 Tax=Echeneis naucrates TaxID=173247 RepID=A0A665VUM4_ECHNA
MNRPPSVEKVASRKVTHWVNPSFTDLSSASFSLPRRRKGSQTSSCTIKPKRKRKGEASSSDPHVSRLLKDSPQRDQDEPWVDRYLPRSQVELAVHKKKIEEVENWMKVQTISSKGGILLLTGPSGCGKTATVQVLSWELGFSIQEWINPTNLEVYKCRVNGLSSSSQLAQFQEFLLRANKYNCLRMAGDEGAAHRKLILVEDLPNQLYRQPDSLHDNLRRFVKTSRCPLVFIMSDNLPGDSPSRCLFPKEIQEELDISSISFNPVAPTSMMKILTRISHLEARKSCGRICVPDQVLETLCSGSSGDIRSAINSLQFSSLPDISLEKKACTIKDRLVTSKPNQRKRSTQTKDHEEEKAIGGKDASLFLFRALGKILHCKRKWSIRPSLSSHLSHHHRDVLLLDPELVVERSHMSGEFFNLYLHQNYLDFFSEMEDVDRASEYLSDADLLTANWTCRSSMGDYASSVATRGLLHSNSQQVSVGFRPLHKPSWLLISKKYRENCQAAQSLFRNFCVTPVSLQTELLPYFAKLTNPMRNESKLVHNVFAYISVSIFVHRFRLEALTDKERGQLETNIEEEKEEDLESLSASQPPPVTNQVLLEVEDLIIEEYTSD